MPLPDRGKEWPPAPFDEAQKKYTEWLAWYRGDSSALSGFYRSGPRYRPSQWDGGLTGAVARFFWGRPNAQQQNRLHAPAPADISRTMADLLFSQPPVFVVGEGDGGDKTEDTDPDPNTALKKDPVRQKAHDRLQKVMGSDRAKATFREAAELASALGTTYLYLWWDKSLPDQQVQIATKAADSAVPEWKYDRLAAVTFWSVVRNEKNDVVYRHLERHEPRFIIHGLYKGTSGTLGERVDLDQSPATAWAAAVVDAEGRIPTGVKELTAVYVPNVRPNRMWLNTPGLSTLGRSDYDELEQWFDALDEAYSDWMQELDLAKIRLMVDGNLTTPRGAGAGAQFALDQRVFTPVNPSLGASASAAGDPVQAIQPAIRWSEHGNTCAELLNVILRSVGLSSSSFSDNYLSVASQMTATEVNSNDRMSERTRDNRTTLWRSALSELAAVAMKLDALHYNTGVKLTEPPEVRFPVRPQQTPAETAAEVSTLSSAGMISTVQGVRRVNPNWSSDDVNDEVARINSERKERAQEGMMLGDEFGAAAGEDAPAADQSPGASGGDEAEPGIPGAEKKGVTT